MQNQNFILNLPWSPSINSYYGITCNGNIPHKYIKQKGKDYKQKVKTYIQENNLDIQANINLKVSIILTPPDNRTYDIDNNLKCVLDSLSEANFWQDDSHIKELHISYAPVQKPGGILVHIEAL